mmetsp:Transcript_29808/g.71696  ORF Transcript_29808/g.71696 Transcript_29808/m.71696 type:complete len:115 (+) Transcript_29808:40-384(+)
MKVSSIAIILSAIVGCAHSFVVVHPSQLSSQTALSYTIVQGIEPSEQDEDARESVKEMMSHRKTEHGNDQYAGYDATQSEQHAINHQLNVDSFSNTMSGGIIPGIQLTSLCGDD